jgi:general secretion pathway protein H
MTKRLAKDSGFTLVEMLVVLAIVATATAIAVPLLRPPSPAAEVRRAAFDLASDLRIARAAALKSNGTSMVGVDVAAGTWQATDAGRIRRAPTGTTVRLSVPPAELTGAQSGRIRFRADGSSTGGTIELARLGFTAAVAVEPFTGGVRVRMSD